MENNLSLGFPENNEKNTESLHNMVWIPGGTFTMGSNKHYKEEAPEHRVTVDGFWMDKFNVTNKDFKRFVDETSYITVAERPLNPLDYPGAPLEALVPGSMVFFKTKYRVDLRNIANWWAYIHGANWKQPQGPGSSIAERWEHPVVHVAWEDIEAYAKWLGKEIASEAEWEFAARGGLEGKIFEWGNELLSDPKQMTNFWHGEFPWENLKSHGYDGTSPVGAFPANRYGLHDMTGNVWEWTSDWYEAKHQPDAEKPCCIPVNPKGGLKENSLDLNQPTIKIPRKVLKGGSHLCANNYCFRYRPAARSPQMIDSGSSHIGFRCIVRQ